jgi:hypothetical protein
MLITSAKLVAVLMQNFGNKKGGAFAPPSVQLLTDYQLTS